MGKIFFLVFITISFITSCRQQEPNKLLLISFDGFRADYLAKTETPNFDSLVESGVTSEGLIPIFPSKTFPNYYAIATGLYPENSGFIANVMHDPESGEIFTMRNREAVENPAWYKGEPIWNTAEKQGVKAGTMFWVGSEAPIQNMRPTHWKIYDEALPDSARVDTVVKWLSSGDSLEVDFSTLYFSFVDTEGHRHGPDSEEVISAIKRADDLIGYLLKRLEEEGLTEQTNLLIVSDHGMAELSRERIIVLDDFIDIKDVDILEGSPSMMMNVAEDKLDEVYASLKKNEKHYSVYKKADIPDRFHLKNNARTPDLLMVADLGYTINTKEFFDSRPEAPSGGTHGFDNKEKEMHALFVASGPDFRKGLKVPAFENVHLYELMAHLLNLDAAETDGHLDSVAVMLRD